MIKPLTQIITWWSRHW